MPGSHHPQHVDTVHREHAVVETAGVRTAKAIGLRNLTGTATRPVASSKPAPGPKPAPAQSVTGPQKP